MAELDRTGRAFGFNYKLTGIGTNFVAASGYVPRNDNVTLRLFNRYPGLPEGLGARDAAGPLQLDAALAVPRVPDLTPLEGTDSLSLQSGWRGGWSLEGQVARQVPGGWTGGLRRVPGRRRRAGSYEPVAEVSGWTPDITFKTPIWRQFDGQIELKRGAVPIFTEGSAGRETRVASTMNARPTGSSAPS